MGKLARRGLIGALAIAPIMVGAWWFVIRPSLDPLARGRSAYERGEWDEASKSAVLRLKAAPDDREALRLLARSDARAGRDIGAQRTFLRLGPNSWEAEDFFLLATGMLRQGRPEVARETLLNAWKADPSHPKVLETLSRMSLGAGRPLEAAILARRLASLPRWESRGGIILAGALRDQGDPAGAAEAIGRAFQSDPTLSGTGMTPDGARKAWARDLLAIGRPAEARRRLESASTGEKDGEVAWILSRAFLQEGAIGEAKAARARARGFGDDDPSRVEPTPFVGATKCAGCHSEIYRAQRASHHASTLTTGPDLPGGAPSPRSIEDPILAGTVHELRREDDRTLYETSTDGRHFRATIDHVFGSGGRGQTFVGVDEAGKVRELRISSYSGGTAWDLTTGQDPHPSRPIGRLGRPIDDDELRNCLGCHATRTIPKGGHPAPDTLDRGIGCEQCHGPGGHHLKAVAANFPDPAIARPKHATATKVVELCGRCHGPPAGAPPPTGPIPARSQAAGFKLSACFRQSRGTLSCVTCHNPHRDAERSPAFYEAKCRSCHGSGPATAPGGVADGARLQAICKVNPTDGCIGCHMPSVIGPTRHTAFSDHDIRVREMTNPR